MIFDHSTDTNYYPIYDTRGNIVAVKNESSSVLEAYDYDPFGKIVKQPLTSAICPFGFQSKYTDRETGLVYFGHRYYDPITNRWINRDPIQEAGGLNLYAMVGNDPVNSADFLSLQSDGDKSSPNTAGENNDDLETRCANGEEETVKCGSEDAEVTITTGSGGTVVREYNDGTIPATPAPSLSKRPNAKRKKGMRKASMFIIHIFGTKTPLEKMGLCFE